MTRGRSLATAAGATDLPRGRLRIRQALTIWTVVMIGMVAVMFAISPIYPGCGPTGSQPPPSGQMSWCGVPGLFPILVLGGLWFVGVMVLWVAGTRGLLVLSAIVVVAVWVMPVVVGSSVECVDTDQAICDGRQADVGAFSGGFEQFFPPTKVRVWEGGCTFTVERVWGLFGQTTMC